MKRSTHTRYRYERTTVYEFAGRYFVLEECQQGRVLVPAHGPDQIASDFAGLSASLLATCSDTQMGAAVLRALEGFDTCAPPFEQFDLPARNREMARWMGSRGINALERDSRKIHVERALPERTMRVFAYDNCNVDPWYGPMLDRAIPLAATATADELGAAVRAAFGMCTYHPQRKDYGIQT